MKKVFEYIFGEGLTDNSPIKKDGNLMVLAINKMQEKGDFDKFYIKAITHKEYQTLPIPQCEAKIFGNPQNFFELMEEFLSNNSRRCKQRLGYDTPLLDIFEPLTDDSPF